FSISSCVIVRPSATSCSDLLTLLRTYSSYNASSMVASSGNSSMACWIRFLSMVSSIMAFLGFNILQCRYLTIRNKIKFVPMSLWAYQPYHITSAKTSRAHRCPGNHADTHTRLGDGERTNQKSSISLLSVDLRGNFIISPSFLANPGLFLPAGRYWYFVRSVWPFGESSLPCLVHPQYRPFCSKRTKMGAQGATRQFYLT